MLLEFYFYLNFLKRTLFMLLTSKIPVVSCGVGDTHHILPNGQQQIIFAFLLLVLCGNNSILFFSFLLLPHLCSWGQAGPPRACQKDKMAVYPLQPLRQLGLHQKSLASQIASWPASSAQLTNFGDECVNFFSQRSTPVQQTLWTILGIECADCIF